MELDSFLFLRFLLPGIIKLVSFLNKKFLYAVSILVGSMVGVGIFGLPFAFAKSGYIVGIGMLVLIALITILVKLMYGEVVLRTHEQHQLMGYTKKYLGSGFQRLVFFSVSLTGYVALLAYIIIAGDFLNTLLSAFFYLPLAAYSVIFAAIASLLVLRGIKTVAGVELVFVILFGLVMAVIVATGYRAINPINFSGFNREFVFLPYGVLLFAFAGLLAVPFQRHILAGQEQYMRKAILVGVLLVAVLYAVFATTVVGISGAVTTPDAISGLYEFLGGRIVILGSLFGIFAITTSFLMLASGMIEMLHFDYKVRRFQAWVLVIVPPIFLFLAGIRTFVDVISLAGGVAIGLEQIIVVFLYAKAKSRGDRVPEYSLNVASWLLYLLIAIFATGIIYFLFVR